MPFPLKTLATAAMAWGMVTSASHAAIIATDDFESYAVGALNGGNGGSGWGGVWSSTAQVTVASGGLSYSNGSVNINGGSRAVQFVPNEAGSSITDGIITRSLAGSETGTVYFSMLFRETINPDFATDFIQFGLDTTGTTNPRTSIMRRNGSFQVRSSTATGGTVDSGIATSIGQTYLLVFKAEKNSSTSYNRISLFVDPTSNIEPGTADAITNTNSGISTLQDFIARSAFHADGDTFLIDELTVGTSFADVVPVPEPSTGLLALLGLLPLLRRRR